jgi:hypothetical protein
MALKLPKPIGYPEVLPIHHGGTGSDNAEGAAENLGLVTSEEIFNSDGSIKNSLIDVTEGSGAILLDENNYIPEKYLSSRLGPSIVTISGPRTITSNTATQYTITNYDQFKDYVVTIEDGSVNRQGNLITVLVSLGERGPKKLKINETEYTIQVEGSIVLKPSIVAPVSGSNIKPIEYAFIATEPSSDPSGSFTFELAEWQISEDAEFEEDVLSYTTSGEGINILESAELDPQKSYVVRVRYKTIDDIYTEWSDTISFTTNKGLASDLTAIFSPTTDTTLGQIFGIWVNMTPDGNVVVIGSRYGGSNNSGRVYLYRKQVENGVTTWVQTKYFEGSQAYEEHGRMIAISHDGKRIAVVAHRFNNYTGRIHIYTNTTGENWTSTIINNPEPANIVGCFGTGIAINADGTHLIVGAYQNNLNYPKGGAVYHYYINPTTGDIVRKSLDVTMTSVELYGYTVAINNDGTIAVACGYNADGGVGAAYVFKRVGENWSQMARLTPTYRTSGGLYGCAVSISGDGRRIAVGQYKAGVRGVMDGAVYIYDLASDDVTWNLSQILTDPYTSSYTYFGFSVSLSKDGNVLLVGGHENARRGTMSGAAYLFSHDGDSFVFEKELNPSSLVANDKYGLSCALNSDGTIAIVSATKPTTGAGTAYIFT